MAWRLIRNLDHKLFMIVVKEGPGFPVFPGLFFECQFFKSTHFQLLNVIQIV